MYLCVHFSPVTNMCLVSLLLAFVVVVGAAAGRPPSARAPPLLLGSGAVRVKFKQKQTNKHLHCSAHWPLHPSPLARPPPMALTFTLAGNGRDLARWAGPRAPGGPEIGNFCSQFSKNFLQLNWVAGSSLARPRESVEQIDFFLSSRYLSLIFTRDFHCASPSGRARPSAREIGFLVAPMGAHKGARFWREAGARPK